MISIKKLLLYSACFLFALTFSSVSYASDVNVTLDSSNGSSKLNLNNSGGFALDQFDSLGNAMISGEVGIGTTAKYVKISPFTNGRGQSIAFMNGISTKSDLFYQSITNRLILDSASSATPTLINPSGGNVGIGTTVPQSTLEVNGDLRLAAVSAPPGTAGKIYFDSATSRLNYHDGTKWIEVDPAYTTQEVKVTDPLPTSIVNTTNQTYNANFTIPELNTGIIVVGVSAIVAPYINPSTIKISISDGVSNPASFRIPFLTGDSPDFQKVLYMNLPVPKKFVNPGSTTLTVGITTDYVGGITGYKKDVGFISVQYIALPL